MAQGIAFNSNSDNQDLVSEVKAICNTDINSYPLKDIARRTNFALHRFFTLAFQAHGQWAYDDTTLSTDPIETINIVSGTQSYDIGTFTSEVLGILRIEIIDSDAQEHVLRRLERGNYPATALPELVTDNGAIPNMYDLVGETIYLYDKPDFTRSNALRFYVERGHKTIVSTFTTEKLPVPSLFSKYICNLVSLPYLIENKKDQKNDIAALIAKDEVAIIDYFGNREKGHRKKMTMNIRRFR